MQTVLLLHFNLVKFFNDHILFEEHTPLLSIIFLLTVLKMSIKTGLFFFQTFCCIISLASGIIDHLLYYGKCF